MYSLKLHCSIHFISIIMYITITIIIATSTTVFYRISSQYATRWLTSPWTR